MAKSVVKVPGKVMLSGEYAVLFGTEALSATLNCTMDIHVCKSEDQRSEVSSNLWAEPKYLNSGFDYHEPLLETVAWGIETYKAPPLKVKVESALTPAWGIGSSSALRLGVLLGIKTWMERKIPDQTSAWAVGKLAWDLQRQSQKRASGYDIATQLVGGLYRFQSNPGEWPLRQNRLDASSLNKYVKIYIGGNGAPTGQVMGDTLGWLARNQLEEKLAQASENLGEAWKTLLGSNPHLPDLFEAIREHRALFFGALSHSFPLLQKLKEVKGLDQSWSFKTTGAGGEDAILLVGETSLAEDLLSKLGWSKLPAEFTNFGTDVRFIEGT